MRSALGTLRDTHGVHSGVHMGYSVQCGAAWCSLVQLGAAWCSWGKRGGPRSLRPLAFPVPAHQTAADMSVLRATPTRHVK